MEKSYNNTLTMSLLKPQCAWLRTALFAALLTLPQLVSAQNNSGAAFLNVLPGSRQQGMGNATTAMIDDMHAIYANPAATAYLREWQWSASYTKWIADVYNASFLYGQHLSLPGLPSMRMMLGAAYQGIPLFDSTDREAAAASANDIIFSVGLGHPFRLFHQRFAFGTNIKYYQNSLAQYQAQAFMFDAGLLYRTEKFDLLSPVGSYFEESIFSAGLSISHVGKNLDYSIASTPLPRAVRAGLTLNTGTHHGPQLIFSANYLKTKNARGVVSVGSELAWRKFISLRGGYAFHSDMLSRFSFGFSMRLQHLKNFVSSFIPRSNNAFEFHSSFMQSNDLFPHTYRGSINRIPVGPEKYAFIEPVFNAKIESRDVILRWEESHDPDLYDSISYRLAMSTDSLKMAQFAEKILIRPEPLQQIGHMPDILLTDSLAGSSYHMKDLKAGTYYWLVVASDKDDHRRLAEKKGAFISRFDVVPGWIEITSINFEPDPWITTDDYQGTINITIANKSKLSTADLNLVLTDSSLVGTSDISSHFEPVIVAGLEGGESREIKIDWRQKSAGAFAVAARIINTDSDEHAAQSIYSYRREIFHTIPKGGISADDSATTFISSNYIYDLPFITEVYFKPNSAVVGHEYKDKWFFEPILKKLGKRLKAQPDAKISLQGVIDPNTGENDLELAQMRSREVKKALIEEGATEEQIQILRGQKLTRRQAPSKAEDATWIFDERRYVKIRSDIQSQRLLFDPVSHADKEYAPLPTTFYVDISSPVQIKTSQMTYKNMKRSIKSENPMPVNEKTLFGSIGWQMPFNERDSISIWVNKNIDYSLSIVDTLGRTFKTRPQQLYLRSHMDAHEQRLAWPLKFAKAEPIYDFYWQKLYEFINSMLQDKSLHLKFVGHACAIGSASYNQKLSEQRATAFKDRFLSYVRSNHPHAAQNIINRLDKSVGMGEKTPLFAKHDFCNLNHECTNDTPLERKMNRRIEIVFYQLVEPLESFGRGFNALGENEN